MQVPASVESLLAGGAIGHLVTVDQDGGPQVSCAWVGIEDDEFVIGTLFDQRKLRNIRREPRVALSFESDVTNEWGLKEYLVVRGSARVTEGGAPELLQRLAHVYLGPDVRFPPMPDPPPGFVTRIKAESFGGVGPWATTD